MCEGMLIIILVLLGYDSFDIFRCCIFIFTLVMSLDIL